MSPASRRACVRSTSEREHSLGLKVVAEGVGEWAGLCTAARARLRRRDLLVGGREAELRYVGAVHQDPQQRLDLLAIGVIESAELWAVQIEHTNEPLALEHRQHHFGL